MNMQRAIICMAPRLTDGTRPPIVFNPSSLPTHQQRDSLDTSHCTKITSTYYNNAKRKLLEASNMPKCKRLATPAVSSSRSPREPPQTPLGPDHLPGSAPSSLGLGGSRSERPLRRSSLSRSSSVHYRFRRVRIGPDEPGLDATCWVTRRGPCLGPCRRRRAV